MTPLKLLFGEKAWLPSFPNEYMQKIHYSETTVAELFNLLQKIRKIAYVHAMTNGQKTKAQFDKHAQQHLFDFSEKVLVSNDFDTTKNPKLVPNLKGLAEIINVNDTNAKVQFKNEIKVLNVAKLKHFFKKSVN